MALEVFIQRSWIFFTLSQSEKFSSPFHNSDSYSCHLWVLLFHSKAFYVIWRDANRINVLTGWQICFNEFSMKLIPRRVILINVGNRPLFNSFISKDTRCINMQISWYTVRMKVVLFSDIQDIKLWNLQQYNSRGTTILVIYILCYIFLTLRTT